MRGLRRAREAETRLWSGARLVRVVMLLLSGEMMMLMEDLWWMDLRLRWRCRFRGGELGVVEAELCVSVSVGVMLVLRGWDWAFLRFETRLLMRNCYVSGSVLRSEGCCAAWRGAAQAAFAFVRMKGLMALEGTLSCLVAVWVPARPLVVVPSEDAKFLEVVGVVCSDRSSF